MAAAKGLLTSDFGVVLSECLGSAEALPEAHLVLGHEVGQVYIAPGSIHEEPLAYVCHHSLEVLYNQ